MKTDDQFIISVPTEQTSTRFVWILARPLNSTLPKNRSPKLARTIWGYLSLEILFATMHWAMLVTDHDFSDLLSSMRRARLSSETEEHKTLGALYQLRRGKHNENTDHNISDFGTRHLRDEWQINMVRYVGRTCFTDDLITDKSTTTNKSELMQRS